MIDYTEENVTEAGKVVLEDAGVPRHASEAMLDIAHMPLPEFLKFAAGESFVWGQADSGPTLDAVCLVRKALRQLNRKGSFTFKS